MPELAPDQVLQEQEAEAARAAKRARREEERTLVQWAIRADPAPQQHEVRPLLA